jgi:hypothetical protein
MPGTGGDFPDGMMRRPDSISFLSALAVLALLGGCAAPQYLTQVSLIPPADAEGRACVKDCESRKLACQADCRDRYQVCVKDVAPQVEAHYKAALKQFESDIALYAAALRSYEMQLGFGWFGGYPVGWGMWGGPWMGPWPGMYLPPPQPAPTMPTREGVRTQLENATCPSDCGCLPAYDGCFVGCGGQRLVDTICIRHCPPDK